MKTVADLIRAHPFLHDLDDAAVALIAGCGSNTVFTAGDYVFREGNQADYFYLLRSGRVCLETFVPGKGPVGFCTLREGNILGVSWLIPPYRSRFDARVMETARAIAFDAECLRGKCEADHHLGYALMKRFIPIVVDRLQTARLQALDVYAAPGEQQSA